VSRWVSTALDRVLVHLVPLLLPDVIVPIGELVVVAGVQRVTALAHLCPVFVFKQLFGFVLLLKVLALLLPAFGEVILVIVEWQFVAVSLLLGLLLSLEVIRHQVGGVVVQIGGVEFGDDSGVFGDSGYVPKLQQFGHLVVVCLIHQVFFLQDVAHLFVL